MLALFEGQFEEVERLLRLENTDWRHYKGVNGNTLLHSTVDHYYREGARAAVNFLLSKNVDVNATNDGGDTPIFRCSLGDDNLKLAKILLDHGADPNIANKNKQVRLHLASDQGHLEMAELLLEHNAQVDPVDYYGETPLSIASIVGSTELVEYLLMNKANVHAVDSEGATPLYHAIMLERTAIVEHLVAHGSDVDRVERNGYTPIDRAVLMKHKPILNRLVKPQICREQWVDHKMFGHFDETLQKQCVMLAQLWSTCSGDLSGAIHSLPIELFRVLLCELWFAYFV